MRGGGITFLIIRFEFNQGHGNARRAGLSNCSNELVALMDADDISVSTRFENQLNIFMSDNKISIVGGQVSEFIDDENNPVSFRFVPTVDNEIKTFLKKRCPFNQPTVMFRKRDVELVGGYIDWFCNEDYYLWIRMTLANMKMANLDCVLVNMRTSNDYYQRRGGIKYYRSEIKLQKYMLQNKVIGLMLYFCNVTKRFIVQVLFTNIMRGWIFKKFAREKNVLFRINEK